MASSEYDLQKGLFDRCDILATALGLLIDAPNREFTTPDAPYLEVRLFRNVNDNYGWAEGTTNMGILQITYIDQSHKGAAVPLAVCDQIAAFFAMNTVIWSNGLTIKIEKEPSVLTEVQEGQRSLWPVSIPYACRVM